jgi:hypothetical protein
LNRIYAYFCEQQGSESEDGTSEGDIGAGATIPRNRGNTRNDSGENNPTDTVTLLRWRGGVVGGAFTDAGSSNSISNTLTVTETPRENENVNDGEDARNGDEVDDREKDDENANAPPTEMDLQDPDMDLQDPDMDISYISDASQPVPVNPTPRPKRLVKRAE